MGERPAFTPLLWYDDPHVALRWLEQAFGFETRLVVDDGSGGIIHSETYLDDSSYLMVVGPPKGAASSPTGLGGRYTGSVHVQLRDGLDAHCERARAAGARIDREPQTQSYGDRVYTCFDLEGRPWSFGQTMQTMTIDEVAAATGRQIKTSL
jgi:uncharacterized glyoxalase superfamily protein PhnB